MKLDASKAGSMGSADKAALSAEWLSTAGKGRQYVLLTEPEGSAKAVKSLDIEVMQFTLYLAPSTFAGVGNLCQFASVCIAACLYKAGRGVFNDTQMARMLRTWLWKFHSEVFFNRLRKEVMAAKRKADRKGMRLAIRLNGTSDVDFRSWVNANIGNDILVYEYTKDAQRATEQLGDRYRHVYSYDGRNESLANSLAILANGGNVAIVADRAWQPGDTVWGYPTLDGDAHDIRAVDPTGHVVWLKAKGPAIKDKSGFVIRNL